MENSIKEQLYHTSSFLMLISAAQFVSLKSLNTNRTLGAWVKQCHAAGVAACWHCSPGCCKIPAQGWVARVNSVPGLGWCNVQCVDTQVCVPAPSPPIRRQGCVTSDQWGHRKLCSLSNCWSCLRVSVTESGQRCDGGVPLSHQHQLRVTTF